MPDILTQLLAVVGAITGVLALYLQYLGHRSDNPDLEVNVEYKNVSNQKNPKLHPYLRVVLKNKGKRDLYIMGVDVLLFPEKLKIGETEVKPNDFRFHLFSATKEGLLCIELQKRHELICDPIEFIPNPKENVAIIEVTDALDRKYKSRIS